jgi:hypothetical protein
MPALRPLPRRPNLEYARKEAKSLLRRLPATARLADAQLILAREYGFASWRRLVSYFEYAARQPLAPPQIHGGPEALDSELKRFLAGHRARRTWVGRALAAYVPRFYGARPEDALAAPITEDDARLAVARTHGAPSWDVLLGRVSGTRRPDAWEPDPMRAAVAAMAAGDLDALKSVVALHPELLHPSDQDRAEGRTLIALAVRREGLIGVAAMRPVMDWLATQGFDRRLELNIRLCGHVHMPVEEVRDLLARGADPAWVAPSGIPVLEHALLRYWNGAAVDLLAARVAPRRALWIAAGLGDVAGVRRFLDRSGRPTAAARRLRPDFDAAGRSGMLPPHPDPADEEILMEAFMVAMFNGRTAVLEYMLSRGFPVNSLVYGTPVIHLAVGNAWTLVVECLVRGGADLDLRASPADQSARELARGWFEEMPDDVDRRRVIELCGMDPNAILTERDARPAPPPVRHPDLVLALTLASDDAVRVGQPDIRPENLLIGLLRAGGPPLHLIGALGHADVPRLGRELADRLRPASDRVASHDLPMRADAQAALDTAVAAATGRRREVIHGLHLLLALVRPEHAAPAQLLRHYGTDSEALRVECEKWV